RADARDGYAACHARGARRRAPRRRLRHQRAGLLRARRGDTNRRDQRRRPIPLHASGGRDDSRSSDRRRASRSADALRRGAHRRHGLVHDLARRRAGRGRAPVRHLRPRSTDSLYTRRMNPISTAPAEPSALSPMRYPVFRAVWLASTVANLGALIQAVGASWLMISIAQSADMVALVQASVALPVMLLSLAAGALADNRDR